jgi:fucose 4-O-acetylase-like acetyltransferase
MAVPCWSGRRRFPRLWRWRLSSCAGAVIHAAAPGPLWLYGSATLPQLGIGLVPGSLGRLALDAAAMIAFFGFAAVMPTTGGVLARIGRASLSIFLLHGFAVRAFGKTILGFAQAHGPFAALAAALVASAIVVVAIQLSGAERWMRQGAERVVALVAHRKHASRD